MQQKLAFASTGHFLEWVRSAGSSVEIPSSDFRGRTFLTEGATCEQNPVTEGVELLVRVSIGSYGDAMSRFNSLGWGTREAALCGLFLSLNSTLNFSVPSHVLVDSNSAEELVKQLLVISAKSSRLLNLRKVPASNFPLDWTDDKPRLGRLASILYLLSSMSVGRILVVGHNTLLFRFPGPEFFDGKLGVESAYPVWYSGSQQAALHAYGLRQLLEVTGNRVPEIVKRNQEKLATLSFVPNTGVISLGSVTHSINSRLEMASWAHALSQISGFGEMPNYVHRAALNLMLPVCYPDSIRFLAKDVTSEREHVNSGLVCFNPVARRSPEACRTVVDYVRSRFPDQYAKMVNLF